MAPKTANRTPDVEAAVQRARAQLTVDERSATPIPADFSRSEELRNWGLEMIASGELRRALDAIANEDPELAS